MSTPHQKPLRGPDLEYIRARAEGLSPYVKVLGDPRDVLDSIRPFLETAKDVERLISEVERLDEENLSLRAALQECLDVLRRALEPDPE